MADQTVICKLQGPAALAGASGGDTHEPETFQDDEFNIFRGQGLVMIESTQTPGDILVTLSSHGLKPRTVHLKSEKYPITSRLLASPINTKIKPKRRGSVL